MYTKLELLGYLQKIAKEIIIKRNLMVKTGNNSIVNGINIFFLFFFLFISNQFCNFPIVKRYFPGIF